MVRVKPQPPCYRVLQSGFPVGMAAACGESVSREGRIGAEGREGEGISAPAVTRTDPEGSSHFFI